MPTFGTAQAAASAAVYAHFGLAASWEGVEATVTVLVDAPDRIVPAGQSRLALPTSLLTVRRSEVAAPSVGQLVTVLEVEGVTPAQSYRLTADPRHDEGDVLRIEWLCEAEPVDEA